MTSWTIFSSTETTKAVTQVLDSIKDEDLLPDVLSVADDDTKHKLKLQIRKVIGDTIYYAPTLKQLPLQLSEFEKKKVLCHRVIDLLETDASNITSRWLLVLLTPGVLRPDTYLAFVKNMGLFTLKELARLPEEEIRELLLSIAEYLRTESSMQKKKEEMEQMRKQCAVKKQIGTLENKHKEVPKNHAIVLRRNVSVPEAFLKNIGSIHERHVTKTKIATPTQHPVASSQEALRNSGRVSASLKDVIMVTETYANGVTRLSGQYVDLRKSGTWNWYQSNGDIYASWNYDTSDWFYQLDDLTIKGAGPCVKDGHHLVVWSNPRVKHWHDMAQQYEHPEIGRKPIVETSDDGW